MVPRIAETQQKRETKLYRICAILGGLLAAAPLFGFLLMFLIRRNTGVFLFAAGITSLALPGEYFAALVLGQNHGPSMLGSLFIGTPFNFFFYASLCFAFLRALRRIT